MDKSSLGACLVKQLVLFSFTVLLKEANILDCFCFIGQASADMEEIFLFIDNLNKRLARGIKDLDDVRSSMAALSEIRESEIRFVDDYWLLW